MPNNCDWYLRLCPGGLSLVWNFTVLLSRSTWINTLEIIFTAIFGVFDNSRSFQLARPVWVDLFWLFLQNCLCCKHLESLRPDIKFQVHASRCSAVLYSVLFWCVLFVTGLRGNIIRHLKGCCPFSTYPNCCFLLADNIHLLFVNNVKSLFEGSGCAKKFQQIGVDDSNAARYSWNFQRKKHKIKVSSW